MFSVFFNCDLYNYQLLELFTALEGSFQRLIITLLELFSAFDTVNHNISPGLENSDVIRDSWLKRL